MKSAYFALASLLMLSALSAGAAVVTVTPVAKVTADGVEPAEWELTDGWSIVTNKMGVGKLSASGPSYCETPYEPFKAYVLHNVAGAEFPRWEYVLDGGDWGDPTLKQDFGRGAFYASCDIWYGQSTTGPSGKTPSTVWLGTDTHDGMPLAGVKLSQIKKMKYYALVSGVPNLLAPAVWDTNWTSWNGWWYNPRFPIQLQFCVDGPGGRKQFWYRPWGGSTIIGDNCSDGRLSIWEQYDCRDDVVDPENPPPPGSGGRWLCPPYYDGEDFTTYETWNDVLAAYGDYTLVATSTTYDPGTGQWKSVGWKGNTEPRGLPMATGTGKCLNFEVGARFVTWRTESLGFRGQMDYFELDIDRNDDGDVTDPGESAVYDFEPAPEDHGPRMVYLSQKCLDDMNTQDALLGRRGEPENKYDLVANPLRINREERLFDVMYKVSGRVSDKSNAFFVLDDGTGLGLPLQVRTMLYKRWQPSMPGVPAYDGDYWSSWGLLERFRPSGEVGWDTSVPPVYHPAVGKPFLIWTAKTHNRKMD